MSKKHVVIIGGGFGGVATARSLAKSKDIKITLIDRRNYHLFQPLLYQVAMAGLNPSEISVPLRKLFSKNKNVSVILAEVDKLNLTHKQIGFDDRWIAYDYLVLCCGAKHSYFGNNHWEENAPGLKTIEQATEIRRRVLMAFEKAEKEQDPQKQEAYLRFVIVGGGPTGVELAGAIAEMVRTTLRPDYRNADLGRTEVLLVEGGERLLSAFPEKLSQRTKNALTQLGVRVLLNSKATDISKEGLKINGEKIEAKTILWAAGVVPSQLTEKLTDKKDSNGRIIIKQDLSLPSFSEVFAIGDQALFLDLAKGALPGIAPVAIQQGQHVAKIIKDEINGRPRKAFAYKDKGVMATIGRSQAVAKVGKLEFSGLMAWVMWVFVHILYLMYFKNRVFVFFQWAWAYFSFGRGARLITHKTWKFYSGEKVPLE